MTDAIVAEGLTRRFGERTAVDNISFSVAYGEIFGYLGANGAGKSTTIRMLCGILTPSGGGGSVAGFDLMTESEKIKSSIGYVSQKFSLYTDLTVYENLRFFGQVYGLAPRKLHSRMDIILTQTGLDKRSSQLAGTLSGGLKQRLALANALLHEPKVLVLDEPTAGLDPVSRRSLWELLYELAGAGTCLFVTTHYMEEAERCNRLAIISEGKMLRLGTPAEIKSALPGAVIEVTCRPLLAASKLFQQVPGVVRVTAYGTTLHVMVDDLAKTKPLLEKSARDHKIDMISIRPTPADLEDVFALLAT